MTTLNETWGLHWFRRDLRIAGNEALKINWKQNHGRTLGIFCFDSQFLSRDDFSPNRFAFFLKTLKALKEDLVSQGGDLLVIDALPHEAFPKIFSFLKKKNFKSPSVITWNRDYEPFSRARDEKIETILKQHKINFYHTRDHLLFEPTEILKSEKPDDFYQIYSPYAKKWFDKLNSPEGQKRIQIQKKIFNYYEKKSRSNDLFKLNWSGILDQPNFPFTDSLNKFEKMNQKKVSISIPEAGFFTAFKELLNFKEKIQLYKDHRDFPKIDATSKMSIYLKNGSLTSSQIIAAMNLENLNWESKNGPNHYLKELAWREFYYSILYHRPKVEKKSFLKHYENIQWENNETWFHRWKSGTTGFPIVDAGMRELATTGWMHNRVRMIVASFLTKDLLIDWRWGENYFMKELLDGDLAANNGGWQWAASTGCDPQPYFRIFNPWLQSAKFDPDGLYIKKYVKELSAVPSKHLHEPDADRGVNGYPSPIVNHSVQRNKALLLYKK